MGTVATGIPASALSGVHDSLYECCAALIIAVMVVLYFDERVRRTFTMAMRGRAIGSCGGLIGTGILVPLFALAGFISDTRAIRIFTVGYTLVFLTTAFGFAIRTWGLEDAARLRSPRPSFTPPAGVPVRQAGESEREYACEVAATALYISSQFHPIAVLGHVDRYGLPAEQERLAQLTAAWNKLQPSLIAISASYPCAAVRDAIRDFMAAALRLIQSPTKLVTDSELLADMVRRNKWSDESAKLAESVEDEWDNLVSAFHGADRAAIAIPSPTAALDGDSRTGSVEGGRRPSRSDAKRPRRVPADAGQSSSGDEAHEKDG